jgi:hypothetical protein
MIRTGAAVTQQDFSSACLQADDLLADAVEIRGRSKWPDGKTPPLEEAGLVVGS